VLQIEFLETRPTFDRIIAPYIENLKALGVDATYSRVDPAQYQQRTQSFDYDIIYDGYGNGPIEGIGISQKYGSDNTNDIFNPAGYGNPAVDELMLRVVDSKSYAEMAAAVRAIDRIMRHDYYMVPTWYLGNYWVAYYDMYEHPADLPPYSLGQLDFWWYNAEKGEALRAAGAIR
jgi:microcin C transport system substrate-binding protein